MDSDRNFLFGLAAVQSGLIDAGQFVQAGADWLVNRHRPLIDVLVEKGWISGEGRSTLEAQVRDLERSTLDAGKSTVEPGLAAHADGFLQSVNGEGHADQPSTFAYPIRGDADTNGRRGQLDPGDTFGSRYIDATVHATGGIGRVWRVMDTVLGREVALKEVRSDRLHIPTIGRRFLEEARVTSQLEHPNIVPVHDLIDWSSRPYYTMRFLGDHTLLAAVRDYHRKHASGKPPMSELRSLLEAFVGVCNAIAFAHSKGVIHRDLKGQNVILGEFGEVIVLDWGLAKRLDSSDDPLAEPVPGMPTGPDCSICGTLPGQAIGTPNYMPPEQAAGDLDRVNEKSDVFGLGAMLYLILTGRPPYDGGDYLEVIKKAIQANPDPPRAINPSTPPALDAICMKAMQAEPEGRYESARELARDIGHWLADEPVSAYREGVIARTGRWSRRHRTLVASGVMLLAVTTVALAVGAFLVNLEKDQVRDAKGRSDQYVQIMREMIEKMFDGVFGSRLPNIPEADELRHDFARQGLRHYRMLTENSPNDRSVVDLAAKGYRRIGMIFRSLRDFPKRSKLTMRRCAC